MFQMKWRSVAARLFVGLLVLAVLVVAGCSGATQTGTVQSVGVTFSLNDLTSGQPINPTYTGTITVKLDSGKSVEAKCPVATAKGLKGGEKVTVQQTSSGGWTVVGTPNQK
jgi:hypothetical protein